MDLLKGPIREGSRGGRGEFKWSDVKDSKDREYYLGVSVKAPTGRWQQNRDIQWYSRAAGSPAAEEAARARAEELRKIKEAENDALSAALGFKVAARRTDPGLSQGEVDRAIKEAAGGADLRDDDLAEKGVGFGRAGMQQLYAGTGDQETMAGNANEEPVKWRPAAKVDGDRRRRDDRDRKGDDSARRRHHRSRSRDRERTRRHRSHSRERTRKHESDRRRRDRSRSPRRSPRRHEDRRDHDRRDRDRERDDRRRRHD
ncbi:hypothetical protein ABW21_db0204655 [Orbilia brochopaga]|nr:hypothetical protein ABW21_db0204655 [Drechslerella brochopaga]